MMGDGWMTAEISAGMNALSNLFGQKVAYRLHDINVHITSKMAVATVYDGSKAVFTATGDSEQEAFTRAKAWVDEQDESLSDYDLHAG